MSSQEPLTKTQESELRDFAFLTGNHANLVALTAHKRTVLAPGEIVICRNELQGMFALLDKERKKSTIALDFLKYVAPTLSYCETDAEGFCTVHFDIVAGVLKRHAIPCPVQQIRDHIKSAEASHE